MKTRCPEKRAILRHLHDVENVRDILHGILERACQYESGLSDIGLACSYTRRMDLPFELGERAVKDFLRGYLTAFYDALSKNKRNDLDIPKSTRGCYWLQGYYKALKRIEAVKENVREGFV